MNKTEVIELIKTIKVYYPNAFNKYDTAEGQAFVVNSYLRVLSEYDAKTVFNNLVKHAKTNNYQPTVHDLLQEEVKSNRYIPGVEETRKIVEEMEKRASQPMQVSKETKDMLKRFGERLENE